MKRTSIAAGVVALLALIAGAGLVLPKKLNIQRSIEIAAAPEHIYPDLADGRRWAEWTVWSRREDPTFESTVTGEGPGSVIRWTSQRDASGSVTFLTTEANQRITYRTDIPEADIVTDAEVKLEPIGNLTKVTWSDTIDLREAYVPRYFSPFMDGVLGNVLKKNLENLKQRSEQRAAAAAGSAQKPQ